MKTKKIAGIFACAALMAGSAQAVSYSGFLTTDVDANLEASQGLFGTEAWSSGATFSWNVDYDETHSGLWTYNYTLSVQSKDISNMVIEVSDLFAEANILDGSSEGLSLDYFALGSQGGSNPGLPSGFTALKLDNPGDTTIFDITIVSDRKAVWGDMYAKDGVDGGNEVFLYNMGFTEFDTDPEDAIRDGSVDFHILRPDTVGGPGPDDQGIPEPHVPMLSGVAMLIYLLRRKNKA